ncbi:hypothetical protein GobsT_12310 [Gemmata obscuriglobus]|uniref:Uncharacterized protein n=1 Tax=Gemmata obscuriglobus TaxID=114 RepID=A0A2Z3HFW8_9BACT|nr:hypothetical protein [Gemmata obscuriglobus]AWM40300.1 hypothetical protein C1280_27055 [Gemmata obscuriglobus]QEG26491.1 hypothetical protein GobsT_12310 [Gemmata obscuriglobus]VTS01761.1 unnamed protein product [Gemmata obscuriglobus UQM 2246]
MHPWEYLALAAALLLVAFAALGPAGRADSGSDERRVPLWVAVVAAVSATGAVVSALARVAF